MIELQILSTPILAMLMLISVLKLISNYNIIRSRIASEKRLGIYDYVNTKEFIGYFMNDRTGEIVEIYKIDDSGMAFMIDETGGTSLSLDIVHGYYSRVK